MVRWLIPVGNVLTVCIIVCLLNTRGHTLLMHMLSTQQAVLMSHHRPHLTSPLSHTAWCVSLHRSRTPLLNSLTCLPAFANPADAAKDHAALLQRFEGVTAELSRVKEGAADMRLRLEHFTGPAGPQARIRQLESSLQSVSSKSQPS